MVMKPINAKEVVDAGMETLHGLATCIVGGGQLIIDLTVFSLRSSFLGQSGDRFSPGL